MIFLSILGFLTLFIPAVFAEENELDNEIPRISAGSCAKQNLCCPGRDR